MTVVDVEVDELVKIVTQCGLNHLEQVAFAEDRPPRKAESDVTIGYCCSRALIPEVSRLGDANVVEIGTRNESGNGAQNKLHKPVFVVHQVVESRERVDTGGGK